MSPLVVLGLIAACREVPLRPAHVRPAHDDTPPAAPARPARAIAVLGTTSCAVLDSGELACWGKGPGGRGPTPTIVALPVPARDVVLTERHACALVEGGDVYCFSEPGLQELHWRSIGDGEAPVEVRGLGPIAQLEAGRYHVLARDEAGRVYVFGGDAAPLRDYTEDEDAPYAIPDIDDAIDVAVSEARSCLLRASGRAWCWSVGTVVEPNDEATDLVDLESSPSSALVCGLRRNRQVLCFGGDHLERPPYTYERVAISLEGPPDGARLTLFGDELCAIADGRATCWERLAAGVAPTLPRVGLGAIAELARGELHACLRRPDGTVACWGTNREGQLGDGTRDRRDAPTRVSFP